MKILNRQEGMTLLEVLAAITITGFILSVVVMLSFQTQSGYISITERAHALDQARYITQNITTEMRSHRVAISFDCFENDSSNTECLEGEHDNLILKRADNTILRYHYNNEAITAEFTQGANTSRFVLAENVSAATFTYNPSSNKILLDITFTLSNNTLTYDTSIYARSWDTESSGTDE
jgi:prepilin-type N-terminal cleavage/methylation domain-containing protein